jgi:hypothetical protein
MPQRYTRFRRRAHHFIRRIKESKIMSNGIVISEKTNLPTQYDDNVAQLAAEAANDLGTLLKFTKDDRGVWSWMLGDEKAPVGVEFTVGVEALVIGWIRFEEQKIAERILKRPGDKGRLPDRDELSMAQKSEWPLDGKGQPKDPWVKQHYLPMLDANGALVTYVTGTVGGKIAIGKLCQAYLKNDKTRPVVTLDVGSFRSKDYGVIPSPAFKIVAFEGIDRAPAKNGNGAAEEFSDAIPF